MFIADFIDVTQIHEHCRISNSGKKGNLTEKCILGGCFSPLDTWSLSGVLTIMHEYRYAFHTMAENPSQPGVELYARDIIIYKYEYIYIYVYIYYLWLSLQVLEVHINGITGITIHITESKIRISYSENHNSTLFFCYFYMSPLSTLAHAIAKGSTFRSVVVWCYKITKKLSDVSSTGSFSFPMTMDTHIHIPYHPYDDGDSTWI